MHFKFANGLKVKNFSHISKNITLSSAKFPEMIATVTRNAIFFRRGHLGAPFWLLNFTGYMAILVDRTCLDWYFYHFLPRNYLYFIFPEMR